MGTPPGKGTKATFASVELATTGKQRSQGAQAQIFQTSYQENLGLIYRYVYSNVGNREDVEDVTSQIFLKAVRGVDTERTPLMMRKWLFQVAQTTIADYWLLFSTALQSMKKSFSHCTQKALCQRSLSPGMILRSYDAGSILFA